jgi:hypothetical protein
MSIIMKLTFKLSKRPLVCKREERKQLELHHTPPKHLPNNKRAPRQGRLSAHRANLFSEDTRTYVTITVTEGAGCQP